MRTASTLELTNQLMTGSEYLASLDDGRSVYLFGERVRDIANHPAFRNAARSIARLYDALHDPAEGLTTQDREGIRTHRFFTSSYSAAELVAARDAIAHWSRLSYGFMGRTPDYKAAFMATLGSNPDFYAPYDGSARAWYRRYASKALFLNHVLINPPVDRNKPVHEVADVFIHVVRETDGGAIISGAKMLATASAGARDVRRPEQRRLARLLSPELRPLIDRFYRGTGASAEERVKVYKLVWDAIGTEFGGRHELYERNYAGNNEQIRVDALKFARRSGALDDCLRLVDQCLGDYDLNGWISATWR
jgi:aromatic ring hydroxylase